MPSPTITTLLGITGPVLATIGAGLLAYDALQSPMQTHIQRSFKKRIHGANWKHRYLSSSYPSPPYTTAEVEAAKAKLDKERDESLAQIEAEAAESELKYRLLVSHLGFWGFVLVAVGSFAQALAAWLAA